MEIIFCYLVCLFFVIRIVDLKELTNLGTFCLFHTHGFGLFSLADHKHFLYSTTISNKTDSKEIRDFLCPLLKKIHIQFGENSQLIEKHPKDPLIEINSTRTKRQSGLVMSMRIRQEVRSLSPEEWKLFTDALNRLKRLRVGDSNGYDVISNLHRGWALESAHGGPNFLSWHRIYLLVLEAAIGVAVPYWDTTMDFNMDDPTQSVVWSDLFFGNGFGAVTEGPFAGWITADGYPLIRNIGSDGSLISQSAVDIILSKTWTREIVEPPPPDDSDRPSLEAFHNALHVWVDGQLSSPETGAQDPVFFLIHAFVDFIWEQFRSRQKLLGIDPSQEYPMVNSPFHHPLRQMDGVPWFPRINNQNGYSEHFASFVRYRMPPMCGLCSNPRWPFPVAVCDVDSDRCVSTSVFVESDAGDFRLRGDSFTNRARARATVVQFGPLPFRRRFPLSIRDPRVRRDQLPNA